MGERCITKVISLTYGNENWGDLLTNYNGTSISYDAIGNPLKWRNAIAIEWSGRQLSNFAHNDSKITNYSYNADGIRTKKTVYDTGGSIVSRINYTLDGNKIVAESRNGTNLYYLYDDTGAIMGISYGYDTYTFAKNPQGDVIGIYSGGTLVAKYEYSAHGQILSITNASGTDISNNSSHIANLNPFRYRGYYYDTETGFYYLQSRYYDPVVGRWINSDSQLNTSLGILGLNQFSYCLNNPVNMVDYGGNKPGDLFDTMDEAARDAAIYLGALSWENTWEYSTVIYSWDKKTITYETVTKTYRFLWWTWSKNSKREIVTVETKYLYLDFRTDKSHKEVNIMTNPLLLMFMRPVAALHTHPMGSWKGITVFSKGDIEFANANRIPLYVHGPNGVLRKYDPFTGENIPIFDDLPWSLKRPWLN